MPINSIHPYYDLFYDIWQRGRDFPGGEDDVKRKLTDYLPQPSGQTDKTYLSFVKLADFGDYAYATEQVFTGSVFRKEMKVNYPAAWDTGDRPFKGELDDVTGTGVSIQDFARVLFTNFLRTGRAFIVIDIDPEEQGVNPARIRPYWSSPWAEQCTFWDDSSNNWVFAMPRLEPEDSDPFSLRLKPYWHHFYLDAEGNSRQDVYTQDEQHIPQEITTHRVDYRHIGTGNKQGVAGSEPALVESFAPGFGDIPFQFVPVCLLSNDLLSNDPARPPMFGIVNLAQRYYRVGADYAWCMHWSILKQPWASGVQADAIIGDKKGSALVFGGPGLMVLPTPGAQLGIAEPNPGGYEAFERKLESIRSEIAAMGSQALAREGRARESAEAMALRLASEHATVQSWVAKTERCLEKAVRWHAYMSRWTTDINDDRVTVEMNRDFVPSYVDPNVLRTLLEMLMQNKLTQEAFFYQLELAEIPPKDEDLETYLERIEAQKLANMEMAQQFMTEDEGEDGEDSDNEGDDDGEENDDDEEESPVGQNGISGVNG